MEDAPRLFDRPQTYTAKVSIDNILPAPTYGAKSLATKSLQAFGALTLPLVQEARPPDTGPMAFTIVDGARRIADMRKMGVDEVEVVVVPYDVGESGAAAMSVALNYGRAPNPVQEAMHFAELRDSGYEIETIGELLGISVSKIKRRLMLVDDLHEDLADYLRNGFMNIGTAEKAARLSMSVQSQLAKKMHEGEIERLTGDDISDVLRSVREGMLDQEQLFPEVEETPRSRFRFHLGNLRDRGLSYEDARAELDDLYAR